MAARAPSTTVLCEMMADHECRDDEWADRDLASLRAARHVEVIRALEQNGPDLDLVATNTLSDSWAVYRDCESIKSVVNELLKLAAHTKLCTRTSVSGGLVLNADIEDASGIDHFRMTFATTGALHKIFDEFKDCTIAVVTVGTYAATDADPAVVGDARIILRSLCVQLLRENNLQLDLDFINDNHIRELWGEGFEILLWLFQQLVESIAMKIGSENSSPHHVTVVVDGIHFLERNENIQKWNRFVGILHGIVTSINRGTDQRSAMLRAGIVFKYILMHPGISKAARLPDRCIVTYFTDPESPSDSSSTLDDSSDTA